MKRSRPAGPTRRRQIVLAAAVVALPAAGCAPNDPPTATRLDITTNLTICGGMVPPPGEPWCRTHLTSTPIEVTQRRTVVASGTTGADGRLVVDVPAGTYTVSTPDPPVYLQCDAPIIDVAAGSTAHVVQTCVLNAP